MCVSGKFELTDRIKVFFALVYSLLRNRYSSFDDPLSVPVTEDGADSELLPSSPDRNTQRHSLQSQPDPPQENVSSKSRGNYNAQETSNADFGMAVEEAELNNDHVEKGVTIPQVETTSMIAETMQTGPNPTTQRAPIGLSNIAGLSCIFEEYYTLKSWQNISLNLFEDLNLLI